MGAYEKSVFFRRRVENAYERALKRIVRDLRQLCKGVEDPHQMQDLIDKYAASGALDALARKTAKSMVTGTMVGMKATWREAAEESMKGRKIYKALLHELTGKNLMPMLNGVIQSNADLIKTVPQRVARRMTEIISDQTMKGVRPETIAKELSSKAPHLADYQIRRIARTEAAKTQTAILEARAESLDLEWYIWRSSQDERVRSSHAMMNQVYCRWSDPPSPEELFPRKGQNPYGRYHPGCTFNCRCVALPVVDDVDIVFPARVHVNGSIIVVRDLAHFKSL